MRFRFAVPLTLALAAAPAAFAAGPVHVDLSQEKEGTAPRAFLPVVGDWSIVADDGKKVLLVDGRGWKSGQPAGGLADTARAIYGARHEEFLDNVKAFAYYPYAVARDVESFQDGEIALRFKLLGGALDQCAGILFNLKPNGDYWAVRFNQKEDNLVLWKFENGKRSFVKKNVHDVALPMREWHAIALTIKGATIAAALDGEKLIDYELPAPVDGRIGVWSKTDSVAEFADYVATPAPR